MIYILFILGHLFITACIYFGVAFTQWVIRQFPKQLPTAASGKKFLLGLLNVIMWVPVKLFGGVPSLIASRYLFAWRKRVAINLITVIAFIGISFASATLIITLSVFNGFQDLIEGLYTSWDADVRIVPARGKAFEDTPELRKLITGTEGVKDMAATIENKAMLTYYDKHYMVTLKGVGSDILRIRRLDTLVYQGDYSFAPEGEYSTGVLGSSVGYFLNTRLNDKVHPIKIWAAPETPGAALETDLEKAVRTEYLFPTGYFEVQMEYDMKYVLVSIDLMKKLYGFGNRITAYEIRVDNFGEAMQVQQRLQESLDKQAKDVYKVETWYDQHKTLFDVMKNEKLVAYMILTLMLIIAAVNIVGSLSMIVLEKTSDIAVMQSMGATRGMIRRIFAIEGVLVGLIGGFSGMVSASLFTWGQMRFGLIKINGGETFSRFEFFPIKPDVKDYLLIFGTVMVISILASLYPSLKAANNNIVQALRK